VHARLREPARGAQPHAATTAPLSEPLIGRAQLLLGLMQGALLLAVCFAVYALALQRGLAAEAARFVAFAALTAGNLTLALIDTKQQPLARGGSVAWPFVWIVLAAVAALSLCIAVPPLRSLFGFALPGAAELGVAVLAGVLGTAWWDIAKRWPPVARTFGAAPLAASRSFFRRLR
jgi:P-type Ca2+ transporter type 2C